MKVNFKLSKAVKTKWVNALRSGDYKQGEGELKTVKTEYNYDTGRDVKTGKVEFCCLGVARDLGLCARKKPANKNMSCSEEFVSTAFLPLKIQNFLADKNDGSNENGSARRWSFNTIATWIEKNL